MDSIKENSFLLIDKPPGMTSFGVVARVRRIVSEAINKRAKVGHTGTLDPFASGLMILVLGTECRQASHYLKLDKSYRATIILGKISSTGDPEGEITEQLVSQVPSYRDIEECIDNFRGEIKQKPPIFSAIKIKGERAYKLARRGEVVEMPARQVTVYSLEIVSYDFPRLEIIAKVSSGTYIRSLAVDIGAELRVGAYCQELRRLTVGEWSVSEAKTLAELGINS